MTVSTINSGVSVTALVLCLGLAMIVAGGWYFQSSLDELKMQQQSSLAELKMQQQSSLAELKAQQQPSLAKLKEETAQAVHQLKEQIIELQLQVKANDGQLIKDNNITTKHSAVKRSTTTTTSPNEKTLEILRGRDGRDGQDGSPGPRGRDGRDGLQGVKGMAGPPGQKGDTGVPGPKGERAGGVIYVRWGHNSCPKSGAQLVYAGRAGGSYHSDRGGGGDPQCLPLDPTFHKTVSGAQIQAFIYGAEYEGTNSLVSNSDDTDVPCAVCYVPTRNALYMIPAKYDCPNGWTREYFGYLMSEHHTHHRSQFSCVDHSLTPVTGSSHDLNSFLFYTVEGVCGSLPCPPYSRDKELSCAVCTK